MVFTLIGYLCFARDVKHLQGKKRIHENGVHNFNYCTGMFKCL